MERVITHFQQTEKSVYNEKYVNVLKHVLLMPTLLSSHCSFTSELNLHPSGSLHPKQKRVAFVHHVSHLSCSIENLKVHGFTPDSHLVSVDGLCYKQ